MFFVDGYTVSVRAGLKIIENVEMEFPTKSNLKLDIFEVLPGLEAIEAFYCCPVKSFNKT